MNFLSQPLLCLKNIPGMKEMEELVRVNIINLNKKSKKRKRNIMARQFISLPVKLPNMENGLVIFILAVQIGATIVFAQQLYGQVCGVLQ